MLWSFHIQRILRVYWKYQCLLMVQIIHIVVFSFAGLSYSYRGLHRVHMVNDHLVWCFSSKNHDHYSDYWTLQTIHIGAVDYFVIHCGNRLCHLGHGKIQIVHIPNDLFLVEWTRSLHWLVAYALTQTNRIEKKTFQKMEMLEDGLVSYRVCKYFYRLIRLDLDDTTGLAVRRQVVFPSIGL